MYLLHNYVHKNVRSVVKCTILNWLLSTYLIWTFFGARLEFDPEVANIFTMLLRDRYWLGVLLGRHRKTRTACREGPEEFV